MKARAFVETTPDRLAKAITSWANKERVTVRHVGYAVHGAKCSALVFFARGEDPGVLMDLVERWKAAALAGVETSASTKGGQ